MAAPQVLILDFTNKRAGTVPSGPQADAELERAKESTEKLASATVGASPPPRSEPPQ